MKEEFEILKQKTLDKKGFIDLTSQEEIGLMGNFLKATEFENSYGKIFPSIYYDNGIKEFDISHTTKISTKISSSINNILTAFNTSSTIPP